MQPTNPSFHSDIFTQLLWSAGIQTVGRCGQVNSTWAQAIRDNNYLWQILTQRDFKIPPGKYVCYDMPREEYKFLLQFKRGVLASGGTHVGTFFTANKNSFYCFSALYTDAKDRVLCRRATDIQSARKMESCLDTQQSAFPPLPGKFINSKSDYILVELDDATYQFLDSEMTPIATIRPDADIVAFEVLEEGFLIGTRNGAIQLWNFNGGLIRNILQVDGHISDLFTIQLCNEKSAILAWHTVPRENSAQKTAPHCPPRIMSVFGLDGKPLKQINIEELNNEFSHFLEKIDEERFAIVLGVSPGRNAFIVCMNGDVIPLSQNSMIRDMAVDNGKIYTLEDESFIKIWNADGQYLGRTICTGNAISIFDTKRLPDKIDVFNDKIYCRCFNDPSVAIHDLSLLPRDNRAWYLDLAHFKMFSDADKNQVYGAFYCLIKPKLKNGEDYFGCAQHAFEGIRPFTGRFDDSLRKEAIAAHLLLSELNTAIAAEDGAGARNCFTQLPQAIQNALGWGIWILEGMPIGDDNFGSHFFHNNPTHDTVKQALQCFRANSSSMLPYELKQEIRNARAIFNRAPLTQETVARCLGALSPLAQNIIQKCVEVLEITPLKHENLLTRYSSDEYKKGVAKNDPLICAINNLVEKF